MPGFYKDELSKLEDIEALLVTARDLADRFKSPTMYDTVGSIRESLKTLRDAKCDLVDEWRARDDRQEFSGH